MSLSEYWIGDHVIILSRNLRGTFEGIDQSGNAKVRTVEGLLLISEEDLQSYDEPVEEVSVKLTDDEDSIAIKPVKEHEITGHVIDLHYEKLAPERQNNPHSHIIEFQLEKCKEFMQTAIRKKFPFIRIIHGRGQGKLKAAVELLLKDYPEVNLVSSTPDMGALEIWMK
jgi:dsDNA-specific endonuclease/ATPase MutS2